MSRRVVIRRRAQEHIRIAYQWYESQKQGLGEQFLSDLRERLEQVEEYPESCPVVHNAVRRGILSRFPYLVFYVTQPQRTSVLAVLHHARSPAGWPRN